MLNHNSDDSKQITDLKRSDSAETVSPSHNNLEKTGLTGPLNSKNGFVAAKPATEDGFADLIRVEAAKDLLSFANHVNGRNSPDSSSILHSIAAGNKAHEGSLSYDDQLDSATISFKDDNVKALIKSRKRKSSDLDDGSTDALSYTNDHDFVKESALISKVDVDDHKGLKRDDVSIFGSNSMLDIINSRRSEPLGILKEEGRHISHFDALQLEKSVATHNIASRSQMNVMPDGKIAISSELDLGGKELKSLLKASIEAIPKI